MDSTANLLLPYIMPSQAQKHVTHNQAVAILDALVQLAVFDRDVASPPVAPAEGDRYIVASAATGAWSGEEDSVAFFQDGGWVFLPPRTGWIAWVVDETLLVYWTGSDWSPISNGIALQELERLGIGAVADAANPLTAKLNNILFTASPAAEGGDGDLRVKLNKESAADTVSQLYQTGWSGRAETGLAGNDDYTIKVSADGSNWLDAMVVDHLTGKVGFPKTDVLTGYAVNLFQDSGRFAGNAANGVTVGAFAFPAYLSVYNGAAASGAGKFIHNNDDYGGVAGSLDADVKSLVDQIRDAAYRRYGVEFWVARVTHGAGVAGPISHLGQTYYVSLYGADRPRPPKLTFHVYLKAIDDDILVKREAGQTILKDGVEHVANFLVSPADGWVSIAVQDEADPRNSVGYAPKFCAIYAKMSGHRWLLACPALMGGITRIDENAGIIAGYNAWPG